jgi:hypothetical protein
MAAPACVSPAQSWTPAAAAEGSMRSGWSSFPDHASVLNPTHQENYQCDDENCAENAADVHDDLH